MKDFSNAAKEIATFIDSVPDDVEEMKQIAITLISKEDWKRRESLLEIFPKADTEKAQLQYISSINEHNLRLLISDIVEFTEVIEKTAPKNQRILLAKLGWKFVRSLAQGSTDFEMQIEVTDASNITYFIQNIIGFDQFIKWYPSFFSFDLFMRNSLPKDYPKQELLSEFNSAQLSSYFYVVVNSKKIFSIDNFQKMVSCIKDDDRLNFVLALGKKNFLSWITTAHNLVAILDVLPHEDRIEFIQQVIPSDIFRAMCLKIEDWIKIESRIPKNENDQIALANLRYSKEELAAKRVLENIKFGIQRTTWSHGRFGFFEEEGHSVVLGNEKITIPDSVLPQVEKFSSSEENPVEALEAIKQSGRAEYGASQGLMTRLKHLVFGKTPQEQYFDKYADDTKFNEAFGPKETP